MTSFIELPRLGTNGNELPSVYVNTADIVSLVEDYDGQTRLEIRSLGSEGMTASITTYAPLAALLVQLGILAEHPGVRTWTTETRDGWRRPLLEKARERDAR